jgi:uncharacterized membrane protein
MQRPSLLVFTHLVIVLPCLIIGTYLLITKKGTPTHRRLGKIYLVLMGITGLLTLFIPAQVGPKLGGHFGYLHLLSVLTIWSVPTAWMAAKKGNIPVHRAAMIRLYVGGLLIAGGFAVLAEGRYLNGLLFN